MGDHPRVTCCGGEESWKGHAAFTYRLNQITEGNDSFRDHAVSEHYNVQSVLGWQLKDATAISLEGTTCQNRHPLRRGVTRYANQQGRLSAPGQSLPVATAHNGSTSAGHERLEATRSPFHQTQQFIDCQLIE